MNCQKCKSLRQYLLYATCTECKERSTINYVYKLISEKYGEINGLIFEQACRTLKANLEVELGSLLSTGKLLSFDIYCDNSTTSFDEQHQNYLNLEVAIELPSGKVVSLRWGSQRWVA